MTNVRFSPLGSQPDAALTFVVVAARCAKEWVFCRHRERSTWECPGGHIEPGESPLEAARRELYEETGAHARSLTPLCLYSVSRDGGEETHGLLCVAEVSAVGELPPGSEMACARFFSSWPEAWTYPDIQPFLFRRLMGR